MYTCFTRIWGHIRIESKHLDRTISELFDFDNILKLYFHFLGVEIVCNYNSDDVETPGEAPNQFWEKV